MISEHITRNTYYTFVFNLSDAKSIYGAIKHQQIDPKCAKLLSSLLPGHCVARQTQASWSSAFLAKIDFVEPARNLGAIKYDQHDFIPATDAEQTERIISALYKLITQNENKSKDKNKKSDIEELALKLMKLWADQPYTPLVKLFPKLGDLHYTVKNKIKEFIEEKRKWANFIEARVGRSTYLLMELEPAGYEAINVPMPKDNIGRGKSEHRHYAHIIKRYFENKGFKASLEKKAPGTNHPIDVLVEKDGQMEAYEVSVTAKDNLTSHAEACFDKSSAIKKLTIVVSTKTKLKELIKKEIKSNLLMARLEHLIELDVIENYMERK